MILTRALPTMIPSAACPISFASSGVEMPKPTATGRSVIDFNFCIRVRIDSFSVRAAPVIPVRRHNKQTRRCL